MELSFSQLHCMARLQGLQHQLSHLPVYTPNFSYRPSEANTFKDFDSFKIYLHLFLNALFRFSFRFLLNFIMEDENLAYKFTTYTYSFLPIFSK